MTAPFRVLSLDGGGLRGVFTASFLAAIEEATRKSIPEHFDLLVGTSTGGLIALGLASGMTAAEISKFYQFEGPTIFGSPRFFSKLFRPKHKSNELSRALRDVFGSKRIQDLSLPVVVPSFNGATGTVCLLKTPHHARIVQDQSRELVDVALATSAAPAYLPTHLTSQDELLVDGGVWANNPVLVAVCEACGILGKNPEETLVLSIGTPIAQYHVRKQVRTAGFLGWAGAAPELFMAAQSDAALAQAGLWIGPQHLVRIAPRVQQGRFKMDRPSDIPDLLAIGRDFARHHVKDIERRFLGTKASEGRRILADARTGRA